MSNIVDNNVVKKTVYDKLVTKISAIDTKIPSTSGLVFKTQHWNNGLIKKTDSLMLWTIWYMFAPLQEQLQ